MKSMDGITLHVTKQCLFTSLEGHTHTPLPRLQWCFRSYLYHACGGRDGTGVGVKKEGDLPGNQC